MEQHTENFALIQLYPPHMEQHTENLASIHRTLPTWRLITVSRNSIKRRRCSFALVHDWMTTARCTNAWCSSSSISCFTDSRRNTCTIWKHMHTTLAHGSRENTSTSRQYSYNESRVNTSTSQQYSNWARKLLHKTKFTSVTPSYEHKHKSTIYVWHTDWSRKLWHI